MTMVTATLFSIVRQNRDKIPYVTALARKLLSISATSATAERLFLVGGLVVVQKRSSLSPHRVDNSR